MSNPCAPILESLAARLRDVTSRRQKLAAFSALVKDPTISELLARRGAHLKACQTNCRAIHRSVQLKGIKLRFGERKRHVAKTTVAKAVVRAARGKLGAAAGLGGGVCSETGAVPIAVYN